MGNFQLKNSEKKFSFYFTSIIMQQIYTAQLIDMFQCVKVRNINVCGIFQTKVKCTCRKWFWLYKIFKSYVCLIDSIASSIHMRRFYTFFFFLHISVVTQKISHASILSLSPADLQNSGNLNFFLTVSWKSL